jgi:alanyl-tRNA synthetase
MGLERTVAAIQDKTSIYETDFFIPLLKCISDLIGKEYGTDGEVDSAMRVIAEHSRGITFLIGDGVIPSNEGRGYVLRRLLRRATLFGRRLGLDKPFLSEMAKTTIQQMGYVYPGTVQREDFIYQVVEFEEARFSETLATGLELLEKIMERATVKRTGKITGKQAFKLYDTYGFPVASTTEIAAEHSLSVDLAGFEMEMEKQRERAKTVKGPVKLDEKTIIIHPKQGETISSFVGYHNLKHESVIITLLVGNKSIEVIKEGQKGDLILSETPFYAEMGGQVGDTGEIRGASGQFSVTKTIRILPDIIVHQGCVTKGNLAIGGEVEANVDRERRLDIARNHTATHLLQFALRQVLGEHIQQRGSLVAPDHLRFDFSHLRAMKEGEIRKVQGIVNEKIRQSLPVYDEELSYIKALEEGAIALFDEKYGDVVRVMKIAKPAISTELCGGTHIISTGEIGYFHIISESSIGAGLRRIEAVTGRGAEVIIEKHFSDLQKTAEHLDAKVDNVVDKAHSLVVERDKERKRALALERELSKKAAESLADRAEVVSGVTVLAERVPPSRPEVLRELSDLLREQLGSGVIVLGTVYQNKPAFIAAITPDLVTKGFHAGEIVKKVAKVAGGGGGGKPTLAQAGGKYKDKLDQALRLVKSLIKSGGR